MFRTNKVLLFLFLFVGFAVATQGQITGNYDIKNADTLRIYGLSGKNTELVLRNATKDTIGFLYNKGNGVTEFRKALVKLNDTTYLVGADTLKFSNVGGTGIDSVLANYSIIGNGLSTNKIRLQGDLSNPGNEFYYGTDASGVKGWYTMPEKIDSVGTSQSITGSGKAGDLLKLVNDASSPGNEFYYGTDASGVKGYHQLPSPLVGEANQATSPGTGVSLILAKSGINLPFRSLLFPSSITGTPTTNEVSFALTNDLSNPGISKYYGTNGAGVKGWYSSFAGIVQNSVTGTGTTGDGFRLVGDVTNPGNNFYYGTNGSGVKGYYTVPVSVTRTASSVGTGASVFKQLTVNDFEFRSVTTDNTLKYFEQTNVVELRADTSVIGTKLWIQHIADSVGNLASTGIVDLDSSRNSTTVTVLSPSGTDAILNGASSSLAGIMTAADKTKLDSLYLPSGNYKYWGTNSSGIRGFYTVPVPITVNSIVGTGYAGDSLKLSGDLALPGNTKYYGTNGSGTKGWYSIPESTGEVNTTSNVGSGVGLAKTKIGLDLPFKSLISSGGRIIFTDGTNDVNIDIDSIKVSTRWWRQKGVDSVAALINSFTNGNSIDKSGYMFSLGGTTSGNVGFNPNSNNTHGFYFGNTTNRLDTVNVASEIFNVTTGNNTITFTDNLASFLKKVTIADSLTVGSKLRVNSVAFTADKDTLLYVNPTNGEILKSRLNVDLTTHVNNTLPVTNGGTGANSYTAGRVLFGAGTSAFGNTNDLYYSVANNGLGVGNSTVLERLTLGTNSGLIGNIGLYGSTSGKIIITPATAAGTWTLTLPNTAGTSGQVLTTNGSGTTTWTTVTGSTVTGSSKIPNIDL